MSSTRTEPRGAGSPAAIAGAAEAATPSSSGAAQAHDLTTLRVRLGASGRPRVETRAGLLVPRLVSVRGRTVRVVLVAAGALLLAGDDVTLDVDVGPGVRLDLADVAATVAYDGRGGRSSWRADVRVAADGDLCWHAEPFVVAAGADVDRSLHAAVEAGGRLALRETLVLGRHGEPGGVVRSRTRMRYAGRPVLAEDLDLRDDRGALPGILGDRRVVDQIVQLGPTVPGQAPVRPADQVSSTRPETDVLTTPLRVPGGAGSLARWLGLQAHLSPLRLERNEETPTGGELGDTPP